MLNPIAKPSLKYFKRVILVLLMIILALPILADSNETIIPQAIPQVSPQTPLDKAFSYQIKVNSADSKLDYQITPGELISGNADGLNAQVRFSGVLIVGSAKAAEACQVRLAQESIIARNSQGETITLRIRSLVGDKALNNKFIHPDFNQFNEAAFSIEGFIDTASYGQGLSPGNYDFALDSSLFIVQFNGKQ